MESGQTFWVTLHLVHRSDRGCLVQLFQVWMGETVEQDVADKESFAFSRTTQGE